ncbi:MAG: alpha/beta hydrolase [Candidatus Abyssobacteria bacterium SURF_5]|uniref:Proline iminopeptidase n=1 Tax=Abyssobacteria bacterium (strain SURF_5) TaxID=2093360 RepID=A0A3A4NT71_ABYX5|nr:MAG: alpha/beta hydrolase [Candidatus Abyssubacteria bacterium SURF_5]
MFTRFGKLVIVILTRYVILPVALLSVVTVISFLLYRRHLQSRVRRETRITSPNGIESLEKIRLGGIDQWILVRGWDKANPVLLNLHGGPGSGDICLARHFDRELVRHFTVAHWDQRGAGKTYGRQVPVESMKRDQFVSDVRELSEMLRQRFNVAKIYLVGSSWGSEIGVLAASRYPELFHAYVGVGQVVKKDEQEEISYRFALAMAKESGDRTAVEELEGISAPPHDNYREVAVKFKWLERFGGVWHNSNASFNSLLKIGMASPDYSLVDGLRFFRGQEFSENHMWEERQHTNLFQEAPRMDIPVYFFVGRYDYNTPFELAERYYQSLDAPRGKQLIWFENSGHDIPYEEPEKYCDELLRILQETSGE